MIGGGKIFKMFFKEISYFQKGCLLDEKYSKNSNIVK